MQNSLNLKELLASDLTQAALRADGIDPRDFMATLEAARARLRARPAQAVSAPASIARLFRTGPCANQPCYGA
jgi:hypothetical protein